MGAALFHADGQQDRHEEAIGRFSQFCERALKMAVRFNTHTTLVNASREQDAELVFLTLAVPLSFKRTNSKPSSFDKLPLRPYSGSDFNLEAECDGFITLYSSAQNMF